MSEAGDEKPVGPNGHGAILEGAVVFTPDKLVRLEEIKKLDHVFVKRFKKLRAEKAEKLKTKAPSKTEEENSGRRRKPI